MCASLASSKLRFDTGALNIVWRERLSRVLTLIQDSQSCKSSSSQQVVVEREFLQGFWKVGDRRDLVTIECERAEADHFFQIDFGDSVVRRLEFD